VSAKRYAVYTLDDDGEPVFDQDHPPSEHGLGHFLNPMDPESPDRSWIKGFWRIVVRRAHGKAVEPPPSWLSRGTFVRTTVTSPAVRSAFRWFNDGKPYAEHIKPFNFLLTASGAKAAAGHPHGQPFRLVAPYETDPSKWERSEFIDTPP
jgi:hypothetical protein